MKSLTNKYAAGYLPRLERDGAYSALPNGADIHGLTSGIQGWKGSAKATHFVMAVHDHFSVKSSAALNQIHVIATKGNPTCPAGDLKDIASIAQGALPATPAEDLWSLEYVTAHRAQPLIEALDDDGSSFITVNEVNAFTTSRPKGWRCVTLRISP
jgi:hypothetical protein